MNTWLSMVCSLLCIGTAADLFGEPTKDRGIQEDGTLQLFLDFIDKYNKPYKHNPEEFQHRFKTFKSSLHRHEEMNNNATSSTAVYGVTKFSDLTPEEFRASYLSGFRQSDRHNLKGGSGFVPIITKMSVPSKVDWRNKGIISPVKNQLQCGACWAFSSVETVESMYALKTGRAAPQLSVQEVIDCAAGNLGCDGGDTCSALKWMMESRTPLVQDSMYPLTDKSQFCKIILNGTSGVVVENYTCFTSFSRDESHMLALLATTGPLTVSVDATTWNDYQGGIIQYHCRGTSNNHAVQIVGYDLTGDIPFYIVRNSWGTDFGNAGYLYIKYGGNVCGQISAALLSGAASPRRLAEDTQQVPSPSHIILTPGQPVAALTPIAERQAKQQQLPLLKSLV